ncbi:MAG: hypothetical protein WKG07_03660 [Hymenobacter sp.]
MNKSALLLAGLALAGCHRAVSTKSGSLTAGTFYGGGHHCHAVGREGHQHQL